MIPNDTTERVLPSESVFHWYSIDGVGVTDLGEVVAGLHATFSMGKLLVLFDAGGQIAAFEQRCKDHRHPAVRRIERQTS